MSRWADAFRDTDDPQKRNVPPVHSVNTVHCGTPITKQDVQGADRFSGLTRSADTLDTDDTLAGRNIESAQSVNIVHCVTGIGAPDPEGAIARLAAELLAQADRNPAIRITDYVKALDYFRARAAAGDADSKSTAKPPQPERRCQTIWHGCRQ